MKTSTILPKNYSVLGKYKVLLFIKQGSNAQTYRVKSTEGKLYFLKLFNLSKLHPSSFDNENNLLEIKFLKELHHSNIVSYKDSGELIIDTRKYAFLVLEFIVGETLADRISREPFSSIYDVKQIALGILSGLDYLHTHSECIVHNEITPQNIMLDLSIEIQKPVIIDFGYARSFYQPTKTYLREGANLNFVASECFTNNFSPQSDLFSVGAILYNMLYGFPPWFKDISGYETGKDIVEENILNKRKQSLQFLDLSESFIDDDPKFVNIIKKALHPDTEIRFKSAKEFINAINGNIEVDEVGLHSDTETGNQRRKRSFVPIPVGKGFSAVAGMTELKAQMQVDVIDALRNPMEYEKYGITIPNGMLLYGPPGCGKTFFARHFAEEVGFNFIEIKPSSVQSKWVNATQENIAKMFLDAEKNAPTVMFIDEFDALVPDREGDLHQMHANAVNELLVQMNDCSSKGIFIVAASNRPEKIDPAVLRAGRLEKKVYLPPPDYDARRALFELYLRNRPIDFGIDYNELAKLTENYVSADIEFLVNEASRKALKEKSRITQEIIKEVISINKPSVSVHELEKYQILKSKMDSTDNPVDKKNKVPFGFH